MMFDLTFVEWMLIGIIFFFVSSFASGLANKFCKPKDEDELWI